MLSYLLQRWRALLENRPAQADSEFNVAAADWTSSNSVNGAIDECVKQAAAEETANRREHGRHPFFCPVTIARPESNTRLSAFSRDMSLSGIGLLHNYLLENGSLVVKIATSDCHQIELQTEVVWCRPVADDWYFSGARIAQISKASAARLLLSRMRADLDRRGKDRVPYTRRVKVITDQVRGTVESAFSRDISAIGMGLLHSRPMAAKPVIVEIPSPDNVVLSVGATIRWCRPCGEGWYISGASFRGLRLNELPSRTV